MRSTTNPFDIPDASSGRLIVFEGPDGVGKSTVSAAVAAHLEIVGSPGVLLSFPGSLPGTLGKLVYEVHHEPERFGITGMTPASRQVLHIAAHLDAIERIIAPTLRAGSHVLLDRYWWSTWVYGLVGGTDRRVLHRMIELERALWGETLPALAVLLRRASPVDAAQDVNWRALRREYDRLAQRERRHHPVMVVENNGDLQTTVKTVLARVLEQLSLPTGADEESGGADGTQLSLELEPGTRADSDRGPTILTHLSPAVATAVYNTYWRFAAERQQVFFRRLERQPPPWTTDPILAHYKFTNAYRASDRVSQYLIRHVIFRDDLASTPEEVFFRTILFKLFNRVETWQLLEQQLGSVAYADYGFERYNAVLTEAQAAGARIYSAAYIMPPGRGAFGEVAKHRNHLRLLERMMSDELPRRLAATASMQRAFELVRAYPTIGDFLAYQFVTDLNYGDLTDFTEMEFVVPGPGAIDGIRKCFRDLGGLNEAELIRFMADRQEEEFARLGLNFRSLWGRPLQLVDCQNLFCEVDKYARVAHPDVMGRTGRTRIKQRFTPNERPIRYWYPPKWGINELAEAAHMYAGSGIARADTLAAGATSHGHA